MRNPIPITVQLIGTHGYTETVLVDAPMREAESIDADIDDEAHQTTEQTGMDDRLAESEKGIHAGNQTEVESDLPVGRHQAVV